MGKSMSASVAVISGAIPIHRVYQARASVWDRRTPIADHEPMFLAHVARLVASDLDYCKDPWLIGEQEPTRTRSWSHGFSHPGSNGRERLLSVSPRCTPSRGTPLPSLSGPRGIPGPSLLP